MRTQKTTATKANILVNDGEKYGGKYVALRSYLEKDAISSGIDLLKVYTAAKKKGVANPVIFYVPKKNAVHIY